MTKLEFESIIARTYDHMTFEERDIEVMKDINKIRAYTKQMEQEMDNKDMMDDYNRLMR